MIGVVVVSHSRALADAAVALAAEMVPEDARPVVAVAAGLDETTFGTDAMAIMEALEVADSPDGVLVLLDLGSALLSAEMALEMVDEGMARRVRLSPAPLVEGLVAAVVTASTGASLDEVDAEARGGLTAKQEHLDDGPGEGRADAPSPTEPAAGSLVVTHEVRNPHGLHARPAAALVSGLRDLDAVVMLRNATTGKGPADARSIGKVAALGVQHGQLLEATCSGTGAAAARDRFLALAATDFGEGTAAPEVEAPPAPARTGTGTEVVVGPARVVRDEVDTSAYEPGDPAAETRRVTEAVGQVTARLGHLADQTPGQRGIFEAQAVLLDDPDLRDALAADVAAGTSATDAVRMRLDALATELDALPDPYQRERAQDVRSLRRQLLAALAGAADEEVAGQHVLVVDELDAATAARLDPAATLGVVTVTGGATGHGVIVASSRGVPVITGRAEAGSAADGDVIAFDPSSRELWLRPDDTVLDELRDRASARLARADAAAARAHEPAVTRSGARVLVECNVGSLADAVAGAAAGAEGSGLVRTELLFGDRAAAPPAEEQAAAFVEIGRALRQPVTARTWDPGGDKPLPFLPSEPEANPMLGDRGIRAMRGAPHLLREQLRAVLLASREVAIRVMFPMVTEPDEVRWARELLHEVEQETGIPAPDVGMMVEVPAAAVRSGDFAGLVDFVSIGTNDLTQYATAADRGNGRVSHLARPGAPAVLDLIGATCRGLPGVPVAVCGDLASDPELTATLVGLGVTELSVRPPLVGLVKQAVRDA